MDSGIQALSPREKETLRLLLRGHSAKSIAQELGLSVHTVNERLREARRKLGVSSSREAARRLAEQPGEEPNLFGDIEIGDEQARQVPQGRAMPTQGSGGLLSRPAITIGALAMSLLATLALWSALVRNGAPQTSPQVTSAQATSALGATDPSPSSNSAAETFALQWFKTVEAQAWDEVWRDTGDIAKAKMTQAQWASTFMAEREAFGAATTRTLQTSAKTTTLPNLPPGVYQILEYQTQFAKRPGTIERLVLVYQAPSWKVIGYFIR